MRDTHSTQRYAILRKSEGDWVWVCPVEDLEEARQEIAECAKRQKAEFIIHDTLLGITVATARKPEKQH